MAPWPTKDDLLVGMQMSIMETFHVQLSDDQVALLEKRGRKRGIESADEYLQTLVEQLVVQMGGEDQNISEEVEAKLESLGYL